MCKRYPFKHGYTLLELMIVLAILVSIMAVSWPRIARRIQLLGPREAALQMKEELAEARERSITDGQAWTLRIERGSSKYEIGPVADFRKRRLATSGNPTAEPNLATARFSALNSTPSPLGDSLTSAEASVRSDSIQRDELPVGMIFDDGFAHSVSDTNAVRLVVNPTVPPAANIVAMPSLDNWKFAVIFQPDGRATESELVLKEQATENKIRLRIRGFTGGVTIDKLERKQPNVLAPTDLDNPLLPDQELPENELRNIAPQVTRPNATEADRVPR